MSDFRQALRHLLPYLRLLTLAPQEALKVSSILTDQEKVAIYEFSLLPLASPPPKLKPQLPGTLCSITETRHFHNMGFDPDSVHQLQVQTLVADASIVLAAPSITSDMRFRTSRPVVNIFQLVPLVDLHLVGFSVLGRVSERPDLKKLDTRPAAVYVDLPQQDAYDFSLRVKVLKSKEKVFTGRMRFNHSGHEFEFDRPILITKGMKVNVHFEYDVVDESVVNVFRNLSHTTVHEWLQQVGNIDAAFESVTLQAGINSPVFLKSVSYIPRN